MSADHLGDGISALLDGELAGPEVETARRHLAACPACSDELAAVGQARTWIRSLPPVEPPAGFLDRMLADLDVVSLRRRRAALATVAACAAAAAALLGLLPPPEPPAEPRVGQLVEAHATAGVGGEPLSQLVPVGVPVPFGR